MRKRHNQKTVTHLDYFAILIQRYEQVTVEEAKDIRMKVLADNSMRKEIAIFGIISVIAKQLTGFGGSDTCVLCRSVTHCRDCVYTKRANMACSLHRTFGAIKKAKDVEELIAAFRARAEFMKTLL